MITILYDQPWQTTPPEEMMERAVRAALPDGDGELCLRLSDNESVQQLNNRWRQIDSVTDVLAFPMQDGDIDYTQPLGDIVVAIPFVQQAAHNLALDSHAHLIHLIIHGTLHLIGFDHDEERDKQIMRAEERRIMQTLDLHDPWPTPEMMSSRQ
ncbi:MAG: rRNA maturation RNase YbeY [Mariprofundales bacterium]|nr:rRNA maturation RNase YbeY [Mariprofundales bacterium]